MSTEYDVNDPPVPGEAPEALGLRELERQIVDRMAELYPVAEEYYKLQVLLDAIDGRDVLPVPDYLVGRVPPFSQPDERRRQQARERAAQRVALTARAQRRRR